MTDSLSVVLSHYETKLSNALGASLNDITGICAHYVTQGNEVVSYHLDFVSTESI